MKKNIIKTYLKYKICVYHFCFSLMHFYLSLSIYKLYLISLWMRFYFPVPLILCLPYLSPLPIASLLWRVCPCLGCISALNSVFPCKQTFRNTIAYTVLLLDIGYCLILFKVSIRAYLIFFYSESGKQGPDMIRSAFLFAGAMLG